MHHPHWFHSEEAETWEKHAPILKHSHKKSQEIKLQSRAGFVYRLNLDLKKNTLNVSDTEKTFFFKININ